MSREPLVHVRLVVPPGIQLSTASRKMLAASLYLSKGEATDEIDLVVLQEDRTRRSLRLKWGRQAEVPKDWLGARLIVRVCRGTNGCVDLHIVKAESRATIYD